MHEAGVLPVGHRVTPSMIIPPNTDNYVIEGLCPGRCTEQVSELVLYIDVRLYIFLFSLSHQMELQCLRIYCIPTYMVTMILYNIVN